MKIEKADVKPVECGVNAAPFGLRRMRNRSPWTVSRLWLHLPRQRAYEHLFQDGRAFLVTGRVRVLVISLQGDSAKVQFL
jgi:hypothetical protein